MNFFPWVTFFVASFAAVASAAGVDADPRLSNKEWKKKRAAADAKAASADAAESKMAAVNKAVEMMESLQQKVIDEGEAEAASYNKFACFCKDGQRDKNKAIKEGKDEKGSLSAAINKLMKGRKSDDSDIEDLEDDIKDLNDDMDKAEKTNQKELKNYEDNAADLSGALDGIKGALQSLKAGAPSLLQLRSASTAVQTALAMADALGMAVDTAHGAAFLQQAPDVEMENYKSHSGGVIDMVEDLLDKFRKKKAKADANEVDRVQKHDMQMQSYTDTKKAKELELANTQKARDDKSAEIAENSQELSTVSATLLDDQRYLESLYSLCKKRADTWDQRSQVRADELSAITAAVTLVKGAVSEKTSGATVRFMQRGVSVRLTAAMAHNEDAMEAVEAAAEEKEAKTNSALAFLQRRLVSQHQNPEDARSRVVDKVTQLLRSRGSRVGSTLLTSLAATITTEKPKGMEKITTLIEELIKRLQAEAANEATQKGWCDKSFAKANQKRVNTVGNIDELNDNMAKLEADRNLLSDELDRLADEIKDLNDAKKKADAMRKKEKAENKATVQEAKEGKSVLASAIMLLEDFYKSAAKEKVSFTQGKTRGPADDAPDAGFDGGEAYKGDQSGAGSVLGMLDIIKSDFVRTIKVTEQAEREADEDHQAFTEETTTSLKAKTGAVKAKKKEKDGLDSDYDKDKDSLEKNSDLLVSTLEELLELKKACVDTGMSYEERVARREEEIAALRKALCILAAYETNGANEGAYSKC